MVNKKIIMLSKFDKIWIDHLLFKKVDLDSYTTDKILFIDNVASLIIKLDSGKSAILTAGI
jgi:hypothetical protein